MTTEHEEVKSSADAQENVTSATLADTAEASRRAAAERRRRILEQSYDRIHVVVGGKPAAAPEEKENENNSEETQDENFDGFNRNEDDEPLHKEHQQEEITDSKGNATSRLQQMRRRRFLNKQRDPEQLSSDDNKISLDKPPVAVDSGLSSCEGNPKNEEEQPKVAEEPTDEGPKYVGVAKMRRKLVAERRQQQQSSEEKHLVEDDNGTLLVPKVLRQLPIFLELLTIILLCLAGMGMGWHTWINNSDCFRLGIHAGVKVNLNKIPYYFAKSNVTAPSRDLVTSSFGQQDTLVAPVDVDEDEFAEVQQPKKPVRTEESSIAEVAIDGAEDDEDFHFDYEKIYAKRVQQGGNPFDLFAWIISKIFSTITYSMSAIFFMKWFKSCPPTFLIVAALGRQVGRMLGGAYPQEVEESEEGSNNYDILKLAKKFVTGSFPTLAKAYRFYTEARTDMYIVLFGWFLGLVLAHLWTKMISAPSSISQGEL